MVKQTIQRRRFLNKAVADNVREVRERLGLTQEMFARKLNEHRDFRGTPRKALLREIRRAENGNGVAVSVLGYIGLRFGPKYKQDAFGDVDEAMMWVRKIFNDADRMEAGQPTSCKMPANVVPFRRAFRRRRVALNEQKAPLASAEVGVHSASPPAVSEVCAHSTTN